MVKTFGDYEFENEEHLAKFLWEKTQNEPSYILLNKDLLIQGLYKYEESYLIRIILIGLTRLRLKNEEILMRIMTFLESTEYDDEIQLASVSYLGILFKRTQDKVILRFLTNVIEDPLKDDELKKSIFISMLQIFGVNRLSIDNRIIIKSYEDVDFHSFFEKNRVVFLKELTQIKDLINN